VPPVNKLTSAPIKAFSEAAASHESASMSSSMMAPRASACASHRGSMAKDEWWAWDLRRPAACAACLGSVQGRPAHVVAATQMREQCTLRQAGAHVEMTGHCLQKSRSADVKREQCSW
jgi:hypothetical protein